MVKSMKLLIPIFLSLTFGGCRGSKKEEAQNPPVPGICQDGDIQEVACGPGFEGNKFQACRDNQWTDVSTATCTPIGGGGNACNGLTTFQDVKEILAEEVDGPASSCLTCHPGYEDYNTAKTLAADMALRVNLDSADIKRMPQRPIRTLRSDEKAVFDDWITDGLLQGIDDCDDQASINRTIDLQYVETEILKHSQRLDDVGRLNTRYLVLAEHLNANKPPEEVENKRIGSSLALNFLSRDAAISPCNYIDPLEGICAFDLRDYVIDVFTYEKVLAGNARLTISDISETDEGELLRLLYNSNFPWLFAGDAMFRAFEQETYYDIMKIDQEGDLFDAIALFGGDLQGSFDNFDARILGVSTSEITFDKNRLVYRIPTNLGGVQRFCYVTADVINFGDADNIFANPLLPFINGAEAVLVPFAGEAFCQLENGLFAGILAAGDDLTIETEAPIELEIVQNTRSPFAAEIRVMHSCMRCHLDGEPMIVRRDEVLPKVLENPGELNNLDIEFVEAFYQGEAANAAMFRTDNASIKASLSRLGVNRVYNYYTDLGDAHRRSRTLEEFCGLVLLSQPECERRLKLSVPLQNVIGELLTGGTINLGTLEENFALILDELRVGRDRIDEGTNPAPPSRQKPRRRSFHDGERPNIAPSPYGQEPKEKDRK